MKSLQKLKIATIITFLIIVFPGKIYFINLQMIILIFFQFFLMLGVDPIDLEFIKSPFLAGLSILSLIFIFKKSRKLIITSLIIQYLWLLNCFNFKNLNNIYYLTTMGLYVLLSLALIIYLIKKEFATKEE
jgi:hypothetical protein